MKMKFDSQIIFLSVKDLEETSSFYEKAFEFQLTLDQGPCRIYKTPADTFIGFCRKENFRVSDNAVITFVTQEVDAVFQQLKKNIPGIVIAKEPAYNEQFKIYNCFVKDPDGYLIEIQRFDTEDWDKVTE
ncbi:MAG: VOC family protein [Bacteroidetes bacterium]|nr:VOC family protein [Bacteroidota bacterium]